MRPATLLLGIALGAVLVGVGLIVPPRVLDDKAGVDFLQYWSASRLLVGGGNPYDKQEMLELQDRVWRGPKIPRPVSMWNPPQILSVMLVFSALPLRAAYSLWFSASLALMVLCCWLCLCLHPQPRAPRWMRGSALLFFASFPPFATSLYYGQTSPLLLAGFCVSLWALRRGRPVLSGLALSFTIFKPHLLYLYYLYFALSELRVRRLRSLLGFAAGAVLLALIPLALRPTVLADYFDAFAAPPIEWRTPTAGGWLQGLLGMHHLWVRALPAGACLAFAVFWLLRRPRTVEQAIGLLVPLSLATSLYGWQYDQMLLLPAAAMLFAETARLHAAGRRRRAAILSLLLLAANLIFFFIPASFGQETTLWYPLYFLALHLIFGPKKDAC